MAKRKPKLEIERKFLLKRLPNVQSSNIIDITQHYLSDGARYRESIQFHNNILLIKRIEYHKTIKKLIEPGIYDENEKEISMKAYCAAKLKAIKSIEKTRHIIKINGIKWEVDRFASCCLIVAEVEFRSKKAMKAFIIPKEIEEVLIMEVTNFKQFSNSNLADKI